MLARKVSLPRLRGSLALTALLAAASLLVSCGDDGPTSSGGNGGGETGPRAYDVPADGTLAEVLDVASAGDTIRVAAGTHDVDGTLVVDATQAGLRIVGRELARGESRPVLQCDVLGPVLRVGNGADGVVVSGLEIRGSFGTGVEVVAESVTVEDLWIEGAVAHGIVCQAPADGPVRANVLVGAGTFGVYCLTGATPLVTQNTIVGTGDCGIYTQGASPVVERNAIYDSARYAIACVGGGVADLACNVLFLSGDASYGFSCTPGADDVEADPLFCGDGSYRVDDASPCMPSTSCDWIGAVQETCSPPPVREAR